ncbi:uncharacterized protein [Ptychodera flava]|uniref:uncharacterized protein n=1 Tax=Ptychodera flava TaxID=63121 RepID=UPI00396A30A2
MIKNLKAAVHPADDIYITQMQWTVKGMQVNPMSVSYERNLGNASFENVAVLVNDGPVSLENITYRVQSEHLPAQDIVVFACNISESSAFFIDTLEVGQQVQICINVTSASPVDDTLIIVFSTSEGTRASLRFKLKLNSLQPLLVAEPSDLIDTVKKGSLKLFEIIIKNIGLSAATGVTATIHDMAEISIVSFELTSPAVTAGMAAGQTAKLVISVVIQEDTTKDELTGEIIITTAESVNVTINLNITITGSDKLDFVVSVKDEYSCFKEDMPGVTNATIVLSNSQSDVRVMAVTNAQGSVTFEDLLEGYYNMKVSASGHSMYSSVVSASHSSGDVTVFLHRIAVEYTLTVTQSSSRDEYMFSMETSYDSEVSMPVVTIEPAYIDLISLEGGRIEFKITNHGLVTAEDLVLTLPTQHPTHEFVNLDEYIGDLAAASTTVVRVDIQERAERLEGDTTCFHAVFDYSYVCGQKRIISTPVHFIGSDLSCLSSPVVDTTQDTTCTDCLPMAPRYIVPVTFNPVTQVTCDSAEIYVDSCLADYPDGVSLCTLGVIDGSADDVSLSKAVDFAMTCIGRQDKWPGDVIRCLSQTDLSLSQEKMENDIIENLVNVSVGVLNYQQLVVEVFGSEDMFSVPDTSWYKDFKNFISDNSIDGKYLSLEEHENITAFFADDSESQEIVSSFLHRWNNTVLWYDLAVFERQNEENFISYSNFQLLGEKLLMDLQAAEAIENGNQFDQFNAAVNNYVESKRDRAMCAKVELAVLEDVVFTGESFHVRLSIENGPLQDLHNINVSLQIHLNEDTQKEPQNQLFTFSEAEISGMTEIDGNGQLSIGVTGLAEWVLVPQRSAAKSDVTVYAVGGTMTFYSDGTLITLPLLPDAVKVVEMARINVHYFREQEIMDSVPFSVVIMVSSKSYSTIHELSIISSEIQIMDLSGAIAAFRIVETQSGNTSVPRSLQLPFGDVSAWETKRVILSLVSAVNGTFANVSSVFEYVTPLGDVQLPYIELTEVHNVVHLVRMTFPSDDGHTDFLVDDTTDDQNLPDHVYDSQTAEAHEVTVLETQISNSYSINSYIVVELSTSTAVGEWVYTRIDNSRFDSQFPLVLAARGINSTLLIDYNVWITAKSNDTMTYHIFDYLDITKINTSVTVNYTLIFGPENRHTPVFNTNRYEAEISLSTAIETVIVTVNATDEDEGDPGSLYYVILHNGTFSIDKTTGEVSLSRNLTTDDITNFPYTIIILAIDEGLPMKVGYTQLVVYLQEETTESMTTMQSTTEEPTTEQGTTTGEYESFSTTMIQESTDMEDWTSEEYESYVTTTIQEFTDIEQSTMMSSARSTSDVTYGSTTMSGTVMSSQMTSTGPASGMTDALTTDSYSPMESETSTRLGVTDAQTTDLDYTMESEVSSTRLGLTDATVSTDSDYPMESEMSSTRLGMTDALTKDSGTQMTPGSTIMPGSTTSPEAQTVSSMSSMQLESRITDAPTSVSGTPVASSSGISSGITDSPSTLSETQTASDMLSTKLSSDMSDGPASVSGTPMTPSSGMTDSPTASGETPFASGFPSTIPASRVTDDLVSVSGTPEAHTSRMTDGQTTKSPLASKMSSSTIASAMTDAPESVSGTQMTSSSKMTDGPTTTSGDQVASDMSSGFASGLTDIVTSESQTTASGAPLTSGMLSTRPASGKTDAPTTVAGTQTVSTVSSSRPSTGMTDGPNTASSTSMVSHVPSMRSTPDEPTVETISANLPNVTDVTSFTKTAAVPSPKATSPEPPVLSDLTSTASISDKPAQNTATQLSSMASATSSQLTPVVLSVIPTRGSESGGTLIRVQGIHFAAVQGNKYHCRFGSNVTDGIRVSSELIICITPPHSVGFVSVEISITSAIEFTSNNVQFEFYADCAVDQCGSNYTEAHGVCVFGLCSCIPPWSGTECRNMLMAPRITQVSHMAISERVSFTFNLTTEQEDDLPQTWLLLEGPDGLTVDPETGVLEWAEPIASYEPHSITVSCSNAIGEAVVNWTLTVAHAYNVTLNYLSASSLPFAQPVQISGYVTFFGVTQTSLTVSIWYVYVLPMLHPKYNTSL